MSVLEQATETVAGNGDESLVSGLAQYFPAATPVRLPVVLTEQTTGLTERTTIEFGTPNEVLFASGLPLEFGERVRLSNGDGSLNAEALVVAMQLHGGRMAVAARFAHEVANWIVKQ